MSPTPEATPSPPSPEPDRQPPDRASVLAGVTTIARKKVGWEGPVEPDMRLVEDLGLDSIRLLTLAVQVEDHFRVCLEEEDEEEIETVGDLVETVLAKLAAEGRAEPAVDDGGAGGDR